MFWIKLKRIFKAGFINFWRNGIVSLTSMLVMSATLFIVGSLILGRAVLDASLAQVQNNVDINVYMRTDAPENDILALKESITKLAEVSEVEYVSREKALEDFRARHADNSLIIQSLEEIGENPLGATLNIKAKNTSEYESIAKFLESSSALGPGGVSIIDKVNYRQNKVIIDRLAHLIDSANTLGYAITIVFVLMSVAVTFNTIRLAIYTAREEITVMRLVGASNNYVRGPFMVEGIMYGLLSAFIVMVLLYPISVWTGQVSGNFLGGLNLLGYYQSNFFELFGVLVITGVLLGAVSSFLAVHRYLKV